MGPAVLAARIAVVRDTAVAQQLHGFAVLHCSGNQSDSLKAGVRQAIALDADQVVICLADMPFVTPALISALLDLAHSQPICGCALSGAAAPPVVFPRSRFADLLALTGDKGAGALLGDLPKGALMQVEPQLLVDLDRPADFERYR
jgi:CTP:molybdopterin cytidylyltransferase MocA